MTANRTTALALALALALAFAAVIFGDRTFADVTWLGDVLPARAAAGDAIAAGRLPGWWDGAGLGVPLAAEASHGAWYPPTWLAAAGGHALDLIAIAHLGLLSLGVVALARRLGADAPGALVAGAAAGLSGISTGALVGGALFGLAWAPWLVRAALGLVDARERTARVRAAAAAAGAVAAIGLAGAPDALVWSALAAAGLALAVADDARSGARTVAWLALAAVLGLALAAVQHVPSLLHALAGHAAGGRDERPGLAVLSLLAPASVPARGWASLAGGAAILALAALAPGRARVVTGALLVAGAWSPAAALVGWALAAAQAGAGLTALAAEPPDRAALVRAATVLGGLALALACAALARYRLAAAVDAAGLDGAALVEQGLVRGALAVVAAVVAVGLALDAGRRQSAALVALAGLVAVGEVAVAARAEVGRVARPGRPALALADGGVVHVFRNASPPGRDDDRAARVSAAVEHLAGAVGARWGVAAFPATDPARLRDEDRLAMATAAVAPRLIDRLALERAVVPRSIAVPADLTVLAQLGGEVLVATAPQRPRAFWTDRWAVTTPAEALAALSPRPGEPPPPLALLYVTAGAPGRPAVHDEPGGQLRACAVTRGAPGVLTQACAIDREGHAVALEAWAPGWTADVDGRSRPVVRADLVARAVAVAPGERVITWRYRTPGLTLGALLSVLALVNLGLALWLTRRPGR